MWLDNNAIPTRGSQIPDHRCLSSTTTKTKFLWKRQKHFELMSTRLNHIHVSLSLSSIIWYWPLVSDVLCRTVTIGIALHWPCVTDLFVSWAQHLSKRDDHATYTAHGVQQSLPVLGRCSTTGLDTTPFVQVVLCQCWSTYTRGIVLAVVEDFLYQEAFLATYRTFIDPSLLIKKLLYRYSELSASSDGQKRKLANNTFSLLVRVVNELW